MSLKYFGSIRTKIFACVGVAFLGISAAAFSTLQSNAIISEKMTSIRNVDFPFALKSGETANLFRKQMKYYEDAFLSGDKELAQAGNGVAAEIVSGFTAMESMVGPDKKAYLGAIKKKYQNYAAAAARTYSASANGEQVNIEEVQKLGVEQKNIQEELDKTSKAAISSVEKVLEAGKKTVSRSTVILIVILSVAFLGTILVLNFVAQKLLINPLRQLQSSVGKLANGELDMEEAAQTLSRDEIVQLSNSMQEMTGKLRQMVTKIGSASREVRNVAHIIQATAAGVGEGAARQDLGVSKASESVKVIVDAVGNIGAGVDALNINATEITSSILEMSASTEEVALNADGLANMSAEVSSSIAQTSASIKQVAVNASSLKEASDTTISSVAEMDSSIREVEMAATTTARITQTLMQDAEVGKASVAATIAGMKTVKVFASETANIAKELSEKNQEIGRVLDVITNITEQTNLLALNAAIIAAQAGVHGKGFAVVADEIRELATRTSNSTKEISDIIEGVQKQTDKAVYSIREVDTAVRDGENLSLKSGEALDKIFESATNVKVHMDGIVRSTAEQSKESRMIHQSMFNVFDMVDQIAVATEQQRKSAELILKSAESMQDMTAQVRNSTREQSQAGKTVFRSMERTSDMIANIKRSCDEQNAKAREILAAMTEVDEITAENVAASSRLDAAVKNLMTQTTVLQAEMGEFKLGATPLPHTARTGRQPLEQRQLSGLAFDAS